MYRVYEDETLLECPKCGYDLFHLPMPVADWCVERIIQEDVVGLIVRYVCYKCGGSGPKVTLEHYLELGFPPGRHGLLSSKRKVEKIWAVPYS